MVQVQHLERDRISINKISFLYRKSKKGLDEFNE